MQNSQVKQRYTGSNLSEAGKVGIKNRLKIIATSALLLAATSATAGIVFLPAGGQYTNPELAPVSVQHLDESIIRVHTTGLTGELTIKGSDFPPEYDIATTEKVVLPFDQAVIFDIDYADGIVSGRSTAKFFNSSSSYLLATAEVRGNATCLPLNGRECGQLVLNLELQGVLTDPNNPSIVGQLRTKMLGSLYFDGSDVGFWAAMSANTTIGGNEGLINSFLETMENGESIQATPWADGQ